MEQQQPQDTAAPAAALMKDEAPGPAPDAATETPSTESLVETKQPPAPKVEDDESDWEELDGEYWARRSSFWKTCCLSAWCA